MTDKSVFVAVGEANLYYEEMGEGHPLVMLHGGFLDRRMWDPQFEAFDKRYRVIRYDARMANMESPEEFNSIVLDFLAKTLPH